MKNLTKEQTAQNDEPPRPRPKVMASAPPSSQPKAPLGSQLTASENDVLINLIKQQLVPCWNVPAGARDAKELNVQVRASVNPDGTVRQATIVDQGRMSDPLVRAAAESARRTFFNPQCTPLKLPSDKYEVWKDLVVNFDPRDCYDIEARYLRRRAAALTFVLLLLTRGSGARPNCGSTSTAARSSRCRSRFPPFSGGGEAGQVGAEMAGVSSPRSGELGAVPAARRRAASSRTSRPARRRVSPTGG